jgi:hypothetical protein
MRGLAAGVAGETFVKLLASMLRVHMHFGLKNRVLRVHMHFGLKNRVLRVHMHFGLKNRAVLQTLRDNFSDSYKKVLDPDDCAHSSMKKYYYSEIRMD